MVKTDHWYDRAIEALDAQQDDDRDEAIQALQDKSEALEKQLEKQNAALEKRGEATEQRVG